jgi:SRSO17 transposase
MDEQQLLALKPELDGFIDRFAPLFGPEANQAHARRFVQGLLHGGERRNAENIAEAMSGGPVRSLQAFITTGVWPDREILTELRRLVVEILGDDDAVWNSDETGFPKKGTKSVGVKRQYSGTLGRTDNCQVAVFANYASTKGHTIYEYAEVWVWFSEEGLPGSRERLLVRRSLGQEPELKYHRSNAPPEVPLTKVTQVRATRWTIEEDIKSAKGQCGLDEYETRGWVGWHHHTALSLLALGFLVLQRVRVGEKRAADDCSRSACPSGPPAGGTRVGRRRNPVVVPLASGAQSPRGRKPPQATSRRATAARAK